MMKANIGAALRRAADLTRIASRFVVGIVAAAAAPSAVVVWLTISATGLLVAGTYVLFGLGPSLLCAAAALYAMAATLARGLTRG